MVDALVLGTSGQPWGFESLLAHQNASNMDYKNILVEKKNNYVIISLNRPDVLNSFNYEMADDFLSAFRNAVEDKHVRAILITGSGRAFCAGQDLEEATRKNGPSIDEIIDHTYNPICIQISNSTKPVVCYVNGVAAGAGANLALACDITLAAKTAKFIQSFINIGLVPDTGGSFTLPRAIGKQKAAALMMSGDKVSAEDAERMGMIYKCVDDADGLQEAINFTERISLMPTQSIGYIKHMLKASESNDLQQQLDLEKELQKKAAASYDHQEGINAFFEKRKPVYKGE